MLIVTNLEKLKDYGFLEIYDNKAYIKKSDTIEYIVWKKDKILNIGCESNENWYELDNTIYNMIKDKVLIKKEK